jgi:hypothetical protein
MARAKSGGGITSNKLRQVGVRTGKANRKVNPGFAAQIGYTVGDHITGKRDGSPYRGESFGGGPALPSKLGNELVNNVGSRGSGKGRTLYGQCGTQGQYGSNPGNPTPKRGDILKEFGPDYQRPGRFGK